MAFSDEELDKPRPNLKRGCLRAYMATPERQEWYARTYGDELVVTLSPFASNARLKRRSSGRKSRKSE